jgi:SAM-dependent methyltransferase
MISVPCNLCQRDDWELRFPATVQQMDAPIVDAYRCTCSAYGSHPQIVQCRHCGYVYANPRWPAEDLVDAYASVEDETYVLERAGREKTFASHLRALEKISGPGQNRPLLDVGAYIGIFVEVARAAGWSACGLEPSRWAVDVARQSGLPVIEGTLEAAELEDKQFDVITLWDVIEHLDDPSADLARLYPMLRPDGLLVVHTMDVDSLMARLMGQRWPWFMDMHLHYFSRRTLAEMLEKNGYEVVSVGPEGRYLSLGYLASRVTGISRPIGRAMAWVIDRLGLTHTTVPVNFGDLMTAYARRPGP